MDAIRWGIVGAGSIAHRFAESLLQIPGCELAAISGRSAQRLEAFARAVGAEGAARYADDDGAAPVAAGCGHERLLADDTVDAVYIALPHALHAPWAEVALRAGKAVLCEKPAVLTADEARRLARAARETGRLFMEGMKCRFTPAHDRLRALIDAGELGAVTGLEAVHRIDYGPAPRGYLVDPVQGGVLYDLGCYDVSWVEELLAGTCAVERAEPVWREAAPAPGGASGPRPRIDWGLDARLAVGGVPVRLDFSGCSDAYDVHLDIACERGSVTVPMLHRPVSFTVRRPGFPERSCEVPYEGDDFHGEIAHFCALMRAGVRESPVMPLAATVRVAEIIDAIRSQFPTEAAR